MAPSAPSHRQRRIRTLRRQIEQAQSAVDRDAMRAELDYWLRRPSDRTPSQS